MEGEWSGPHPAGPQVPTLVGAVGVCLVACSPRSRCPVAGPVLRGCKPAGPLLNWVLGRSGCGPPSSLLSPQSLSGAERKRRAGGQPCDFLCDPSVGSPLPLPIPNLDPPQPPRKKAKKLEKDTETAWYTQACTMATRWGRGRRWVSSEGALPSSLPKTGGGDKTHSLSPLAVGGNRGVCLPRGKGRDFSS